MAFPPRFLDELRERLSLAEVVGRRVRLIKRGREYVGLCPFHKEKTPSFNVVEDKRFYHCFGCGAHGDVIGFTMQTANLGFLEAVEQLARQAGLEVPRQGPEERERAARQATLQDAVEAACAYFEAALAAPSGREARLYLERRGLDPATVRRFRLGYAPDLRDGLKRTLGASFPEALLVEAGLLRRPDRGDSYDYFRHRIIFPIGDRQGRIIAFGGRVLGDGQPKYLNSPETPLFQKGRTLYGWAQARAGLAAGAREGAPSLIVVEGYMDVIALHRAGFATAVAPLGTALTEAQIEELWRLAPEPVVCFDGDAAGLRAQLRALDRALPLLKPGVSLGFATLPAGEDPDTLVLNHGNEAFRDVLARAKPLAEVLWEMETAQPSDTPERRAALERRLDARIRAIADRSVQEHYRRFCRERLFALGRRRVAPRLGRDRRGVAAPSRERALLPEPAPQADPALLRRRREEVLLAALLNHAFLLHEAAEELAALHLGDPRLDKLRHEILRLHALNPDLDAVTLKLHLTQSGYGGVVQGVLSQQVLKHAAFARIDADAETVRRGWIDTRDRLQQRQLRQQVAEAAEEFVREVSDATWGRLQQTVLETKQDDDGATGGGIR
ncbi:MAG TPA: DNA primase [Stellaceae bacterium]|nr:DNA primase [Stellaceae bacterium]